MGRFITVTDTDGTTFHLNERYIQYIQEAKNYDVFWVRIEGRTLAVSKDVLDIVDFKEVEQKEYLDDGYGNLFNPVCPECHKETMAIIRPGKAQCNNDNCPTIPADCETEITECDCGEKTCEGRQI